MYYNFSSVNTCTGNLKFVLLFVFQCPSVTGEVGAEDPENRGPPKQEGERAGRGADWAARTVLRERCTAGTDRSAWLGNSCPDWRWPVKEGQRCCGADNGGQWCTVGKAGHSHWLPVHAGIQEDLFNAKAQKGWGSWFSAWSREVAVLAQSLELDAGSLSGLLVFGPSRPLALPPGEEHSRDQADAGPTRYFAPAWMEARSGRQGPALGRGPPWVSAPGTLWSRAAQRMGPGQRRGDWEQRPGAWGRELPPEDGDSETHRCTFQRGWGPVWWAA